MSSEFVVTWQDLHSYLKEAREGVIADLADLDGPALFRAQGKLQFIQEMLNLKEILSATLQGMDKSPTPKHPVIPARTLLTRDGYMHGLAEAKPATG